jgi:hypothetical protein
MIAGLRLFPSNIKPAVPECIFLLFVIYWNFGDDRMMFVFLALQPTVVVFSQPGSGL